MNIASPPSPSAAAPRRTGTPNQAPAAMPQASEVDAMQSTTAQTRALRLSAPLGAAASPRAPIQSLATNEHYGSTLHEWQLMVLRNRWTSVACLFAELDDLLPMLGVLCGPAQRPKMVDLARFVAKHPNYPPDNKTPFVTDDIAVARQHVDVAERAFVALWEQIDALGVDARNRLLCSMSDFPSVKVFAPTVGEACEPGSECEPIELASSRSPFRYYMALVLAGHPNAGTRERAQRYLQSHDALCEAMQWARKSQDALFHSWWHDEATSVSRRPSEKEYSALATMLPGSSNEEEPCAVLKDQGLCGVPEARARKVLTSACLFVAGTRGLMLDPHEGCAIDCHVTGLDPNSFDFQPPRFDEDSGLVDPETHALPHTLASRARHVLQAHKQSLPRDHALAVRLETLADEAERLDCESKADGPIWQQVAYLMQNDKQIGALCKELHACMREVEQLSQQSALAARKAKSDQACAALLAELDAEQTAPPKKSKRKKKKADVPASTMEGDADAQPTSDANSNAQPPAPAAETIQPEPQTAVAPLPPSILPHASTPIRMVEMGGNIQLPTRLPKDALKALLLRSMDPGSFGRAHEPVWRSAARSLSYHLRKHAANSTAEAYLAEAKTLYERAYINEVGRRANDPTQWIQQIRTPNWYAAYSWDGRVISMCNSRLCGTAHFPQERGVRDVWP